MTPAPPDAVRDALDALGVRNFVLSIHDASFPGDPSEDLGRGSPYSRGGQRFLEFARALGFNGVLFGPQGYTARGNASPYDGTAFSRNPLSVALGPLVSEHALLHSKELATLCDERAPAGAYRVAYDHAFDLQRRALEIAFARFRALPATSPLRVAFTAFRREHADWLDRDALYPLLCALHGHGDFHRWHHALDEKLFAAPPGDEPTHALRRNELTRKFSDEIESYAFAQFLAHAQHHALRDRAGTLGLRPFGDLQIGLSLADEWSRAALLLARYRMGAPPSRTNPEGQDWNYALLDPAHYGSRESPGPALRFAAARMNKLLAEFDGVRIDHPHGLVCPWVYRDTSGDRLEAVRAGARLFSSPNLHDHPDLARYAIAREDQLDPGVPRYAEHWVKSLEPAQIERYSILFDTIVDAARAHGRQHEHLLCEVLSTLPFPLQCVMERHGLGRFRVTQKADPNNPGDVYRTENARPNDWVMVGNHDTAPAWVLPERWAKGGALADQARYLATRMDPSGERRESLEREYLRDPGALLHAKFADLFVCAASNVQVFFTDLLGMRDSYNVPGSVSDDNWSLRVPPDYPQVYRARANAGEALDIPRALAMALRARGSECGELVARLESERA